jgi:hypothetical protein
MLNDIMPSVGFYYDERLILFIIMLNVIMLSVITLSVVAPKLPSLFHAVSLLNHTISLRLLKNSMVPLISGLC